MFKIDKPITFKRYRIKVRFSVKEAKLYKECPKCHRKTCVSWKKDVNLYYCIRCRHGVTIKE